MQLAEHALAKCIKHNIDDSYHLDPDPIWPEPSTNTTQADHSGLLLLLCPRRQLVPRCHDLRIPHKRLTKFIIFIAKFIIFNAKLNTAPEISFSTDPNAWNTKSLENR